MIWTNDSHTTAEFSLPKSPIEGAFVEIVARLNMPKEPTAICEISSGFIEVCSGFDSLGNLAIAVQLMPNIPYEKVAAF